MGTEQIRADWTCVVGGRRCPSQQENGQPRLNCIAEVIEREHVSPRTLAQRLGMTITEVLEKSRPTNDLRLSELYHWQTVLQVPISELVVELDTNLSAPVRHRCQLLKAMRTVRSIQETARDESVQTMALQLAEQLMEMMPELSAVAAWPTVGQRRTSSDLGAVASRTVPDHLLHDPPVDA